MDLKPTDDPNFPRQAEWAKKARKYCADFGLTGDSEPQYALHWLLKEEYEAGAEEGHA